MVSARERTHAEDKNNNPKIYKTKKGLKERIKATVILYREVLHHIQVLTGTG